jgi:flagellar motor protein MotB
MKKRRRSWATGGEVGLADMAIAVLGPITFLMLVFLATSARNESHSCRILGVDEVKEQAGQLKTWLDDEERSVAAILAAKNAACGANSPGPAAAQTLPSMTPQFLTGLCGGEMQRVFDKAGVDAGKIQSVGARRAALDRDLARCLANRGQCSALPDEKAKAAAADRLKLWFVESKTARDGIKAKISELCSAAGQRLPTQVRLEDSGLVPRILADLCPPDRADVLARAGIAQNEVLSVASELEAAGRTISFCALGRVEPVCEKLDGAAHKALVRRIKEWSDQVRAQLSAGEKFSHCPELPAREEWMFPVTVTPPDQANLCPSERQSLLRDAGVTPQMLKEYQRKSFEIVSKMHGCLSSEITTETDRSINFITCSTDYADSSSGAPLTLDLVREKFDEIAKKILTKMAAAKFQYNRIDVLGHTDDYRINPEKPCPGNIKTNAELSSLRSHRFMNDLKDAIKRLATPDPIAPYVPLDRNAQRLNELLGKGSIRLYAIGVGEAEPFCIGDNDSARRLNRRIEFRFAYEGNRPVPRRGACAAP